MNKFREINKTTLHAPLPHFYFPSSTSNWICRSLNFYNYTFLPPFSSLLNNTSMLYKQIYFVIYVTFFHFINILLIHLPESELNSSALIKAAIVFIKSRLLELVDFCAFACEKKTTSAVRSGEFKTGVKFKRGRY